jgi:hypothetical protein
MKFNKNLASAPQDNTEDLLCVCEDGGYIFSIGRHIGTHNLHCGDRFKIIGWFQLPEKPEFIED